MDDEKMFDLGISGEIAKTREESRIKMAKMLIWVLGLLIGLSLYYRCNSPLYFTNG